MRRELESWEDDHINTDTPARVVQSPTYRDKNSHGQAWCTTVRPLSIAIQPSTVKIDEVFH
jgi:hypothetical protein